MALGRGGSVVMTVLAALSALFVSHRPIITLGHTNSIQTASVVMLVASRLIFAIARDGALPFSSWVGRTTVGGRPNNAVTVMYISCATLLCTIVPSASAFTSLMSCGLVPLASAYGIIALLRLILTPDGFKSTKYPLGKFSKPIYFVTAVFNAIVFAVCLLFRCIAFLNAKCKF